MHREPSASVSLGRANSSFQRTRRSRSRGQSAPRCSYSAGPHLPFAAADPAWAPGAVGRLEAPQREAPQPPRTRAQHGAVKAEREGSSSKAERYNLGLRGEPGRRWDPPPGQRAGSWSGSPPRAQAPAEPWRDGTGRRLPGQEGE